MSLDIHGSRIAVRQIGAYALTLTRYDRGASIPTHGHDEAYVAVVVAGAYRELASGASRDCVAHSIIVHAPGERHSDSFSARPTTCLNVHGGAFDRSAILASPDATVIGTKLQQEFRHPDSYSPMVVEALMLELLAASARQRENESAPSWLRRVRATMEQRFHETLTLEALAATVNINPAHLAREYRRHYDATVGETLRELRVAYAKRRLESTTPLQEIALDAGFADQSHFTRTFRRATGVTPAHFRRALR